MTITEIAKTLLDSNEAIHEAKNIELQNWTNDLSDGQLQSLWMYAVKKNLRRYSEKENDGVFTRYIAKVELDALVSRHQPAANG